MGCPDLGTGRSVQLKTARYGDLTFLEIKERADNGCVAIVPTGCTEQQGPHLSVDFDTWFAETFMNAVSEYAKEHYGVCSLVLPALPYGPTPEHRHFGYGYIDIPQTLHQDLIRATVKSLSEQGFTRIILWRGCGAHQLQGVADEINAHSEDLEVFVPDAPYHESWCRIGDPSVPGGHADSFTTSLALYLRPESVREDKIVNPNSAAVDWDDPQLDFAQYSATGVIGDPTHASTELGEKLWRDIVKSTAQLLKRIALGDVAPLSVTYGSPR